MRATLVACLAAVRPRIGALSAATTLALTALHAPAQSPTQPPLRATPYPGEMALHVDATDLDHRILRVQQRIPVKPGPLQLHFPRWLPGTHAPGGDVVALGGLRFTAGGQVLPWMRDPLDTHTFRVDVPAGASVLVADFQHLSPVARDGRDGARITVTQHMLNVQWNSVVLYPAGHDARAVRVRPTLVLPAGWSYGTALRASAAGTIRAAAPATAAPAPATAPGVNGLGTKVPSASAKSARQPSPEEPSANEKTANSPTPNGSGASGAMANPSDAQRPDADTVQFDAVTLDTLVDSPVFAGRHVRRIELDPPGTPRPVVLTLVADRDTLLKASEQQIEAHRELVRQADKLFASRHFAHYDFLLALSDEQSGIGLEHHQSSENGVRPDYFENWERRAGSRELLPHEYTHSWNGKFRRPADLLTPNFNVPMRNSLLWVYEGQTQFWGWVLAARSGLTSPEQAREHLALTAANYAQRAGRIWRNLQDTTDDNIANSRSRGRPWGDWQRGGSDYYEESLLIWLDADTLLRDKSGGTRSMDNFASAFFGVRDGDLGPLAYTFDDLVQALNRVQANDWAGFLRSRLDSNQPLGPLDGLARAGWALAWSDVPSEGFRSREQEDRTVDHSYSLGLQLAADGRIGSVAWGGPAFTAGVAPGAQLLAVNGRAYKPALLKDAISGNKAGTAPLELLLRDGETFRTVRIDYRGGLRYPRLERLPNTEDRLAALLARR